MEGNTLTKCKDTNSTEKLSKPGFKPGSVLPQRIQSWLMLPAKGNKKVAISTQLKIDLRRESLALKYYYILSHLIIRQVGCMLLTCGNPANRCWSSGEIPRRWRQQNPRKWQRRQQLTWPLVCHRRSGWRWPLGLGCSSSIGTWSAPTSNKTQWCSFEKKKRQHMLVMFSERPQD